MISGVSRVVLYTDDQDRAKGFWTNTMGFELVQDTPYTMGEGREQRWIEVMPPDKNVILVLSARQEGWPDTAGHLSHVLFHCDDIQRTYQQLTERGVQFTEPPSEQFWGWWAVFKDPDGHLYGLGQRSA
jgi:catechol 2,3-dioxygenase-like lactoylglutathione lyase family enzyme